jgi:hypothetical protein
MLAVQIFRGRAHGGRDVISKLTDIKENASWSLTLLMESLHPPTCEKYRYIYVHIHTYMYIYIHTYIDTYIRTHARTHIHISICARMCESL